MNEKHKGIISRVYLPCVLNAMDNGAALRTNYEVTAIVKAEDGFRICSKDGRQILAKYLINCAGGYADKIAGLLDDKFAAPGEMEKIIVKAEKLKAVKKEIIVSLEEIQ